MADRTLVEIRKPLMDDYLVQNDEDAKEIISQISNESEFYDLHIYIDSKEMFATAISMSMSKRHNIEYFAHVSKFPGCEYIHGYLKSGYFKEVDFTE